MLVAQQRTGDQGLPVAAEHLVGLLRSWGPDQLRGLALAGISVPSRAGPRFIDALVFTRSGVVVLAAHEPGLVTGAEPGPQVGVAVAAVKGALGALGGGEYVTGLVVVVPLGAAAGFPLGRNRSRRRRRTAAARAGGTRPRRVPR